MCSAETWFQWYFKQLGGFLSLRKSKTFHVAADNAWSKFFSAKIDWNIHETSILYITDECGEDTNQIFKVDFSLQIFFLIMKLSIKRKKIHNIAGCHSLLISRCWQPGRKKNQNVFQSSLSFVTTLTTRQMFLCELYLSCHRIVFV